MNFVEQLDRGIDDGKKGLNKGVPGGLPRLDKQIFNIQFGKQYSIVGAPKSGKTYFMLWRYIFQPWINGERNIKWFLYSFEVDCRQVAARLASMFIHYEYGKAIDPNVLLMFGDNKLTAEQENMYNGVKEKYLIPLQNNLTIIEDKINPTGIYKAAIAYAINNGEILYEPFTIINDNGEAEERKRKSSYVPKNKDEKVFILIDTLGLMKKEKGFNKKENMDKWLDDYAIELRNIFKYTIINCHHLNRSLNTVERKKYSKDNIQPELEDIKDTSAIAESSDMVIALFNPNVHAELNYHQGYNIVKLKGYYRSSHILASRFTECPINTGMIFDYKTGFWRELPLPNTPDIEKVYDNFKLI